MSGTVAEKNNNKVKKRNWKEDLLSFPLV